MNEALRQRLDTIHERWVDAALAVYPERTVALFRRQRDRFANPVTYALRTGTRAVLEGLCREGNAEPLAAGLQDTIRIRAVQELSPAAALAFVPELKTVLREELAEGSTAAGTAPELAALERRIDQLALDAFAFYGECRTQLLVLRERQRERGTTWLNAKLRARAQEVEEK